MYKTMYETLINNNIRQYIIFILDLKRINVFYQWSLMIIIIIIIFKRKESGDKI